VISTHQTTLCGGEGATTQAGSNAYAGVVKYDGQNESNWKWAQTGYVTFRNQGSPTAHRNRYAETQAGPNPPDYDIEVGSPPLGFSHEYLCYLNGQVSGTWLFEYDGTPWHQFTHTGWQGVVGSHYQWVAEIDNKEDEMVGSAGAGNECAFLLLRYILNWGAWQQETNIVAGDLRTDDPAQWGIQVDDFFIGFLVWDKNP
jgi:hypothetical protein